MKTQSQICETFVLFVYSLRKDSEISFISFLRIKPRVRTSENSLGQPASPS